MKRFKLAISLFLAIIFYTSAWGSFRSIVTDSDPGEIYFIGTYPDSFEAPALYASADYGETIQLQDYFYNNLGAYWYGHLLGDAMDNAFYRTQFTFDLTTNGGTNWTMMNDTITGNGYATGRIPGEVYRHAPYPILFQIQRSLDYGHSFSPCSTLGMPDSSGGIADISLGSIQGEVYAFMGDNSLYYSSDSAEHFSFLNNLYQLWSIPCTADILNGAQPGEIYVYLGHQSYNKIIYRIYDYGTQIQTIGFFPLGCDWYCSPAIADTPGELYFLALYPEMAGGGITRIYHTTNYGQDWTYFEHNMMPGGGVQGESPTAQPHSTSLNVFPNPFNPTTTLTFSLPVAANVRLEIYDINGRSVGATHASPLSKSSWYPAGIHNILFNGSDLSSGIYFVQMKAANFSQAQKIVLLK